MMKFSIFSLLPVLSTLLWGQQGHAAVLTEDNRMAAFMGYWQACPTPEQYRQYTHVFLAFAVSYQYNAAKNICDTSCTIVQPSICNSLSAAGQTQLVRDMQAAGVKVLLSFGGAGMGGSWDGLNDCWEYCFGKETYVVSQLTAMVNNMGLDGVDIDYEYYYTNNANFDKGPQAINFLSTITSGLKNQLPAGRNMVTHTPMDSDLAVSLTTGAQSAYVDMLASVSDSIDFLMIQFYNGYARPAQDGFDGPTVYYGSMKASTIFDNVVDNVFGGQEHRVVVGFCIADCSYTGSNADATSARNVMAKVNTDYECAGGAGFWVAVHDNGGTWSSEVNQALTTSRGCSGSYTQATNTGGGGGITTGTVAATTTAGNSGGGGGCSCPASYTGLYPVNDCKSFVHCSNGSPSSAWIDCQAGLLFDASQQVCNWAALVTCACDGGGAPATTTTTTTTQQQTPSTTSTSTTTSSTSTTSTSTSTSTTPSTTTTTTSTTTTVPPTTTTTTTQAAGPSGPCCPTNYNGYYPVDDCTTFILCTNGNIYPNALFPCPNGLLFDVAIQACNWPSAVSCDSSCNE